MEPAYGGSNEQTGRIRFFVLIESTFIRQIIIFNTLKAVILYPITKYLKFDTRCLRYFTSTILCFIYIEKVRHVAFRCTLLFLIVHHIVVLRLFSNMSSVVELIQCRQAEMFGKNLANERIVRRWIEIFRSGYSDLQGG